MELKRMEIEAVVNGYIVHCGPTSAIFTSLEEAIEFIRGNIKKIADGN